MNHVDSVLKFVGKTEFSEWLGKNYPLSLKQNNMIVINDRDAKSMAGQNFISRRYNESSKVFENSTSTIDEPYCINRKNTITQDDLCMKYNQDLLVNFNQVTVPHIFPNILLREISSYRDVVLPCQTEHGDALNSIIALHCLNHVLNCNKIIRKNSKKLSKNTSEIIHDQGFTRPRILIILPMKSMVLELVNRIVQVHGGSTVMNKSRFYSEFQPIQDQTNLINARTNLPSDYVSLFGGNSDDYFRLGIGVTKNTLKLYENFYRSEIIIASPLGLRTLLGSEGDADRDFNFLSSIQIAILSHTNMFMMQNWEHLIDTLYHVNLLPTSTTYTDFSRIYEHCSEQQSKYYRQTLVFSDFLFPELNSLARRFCNNHSGVSTITCSLSSQPPKISSQTILSKFSTDTHHTDHLSRMEAFNTILQDIKSQHLGYVLVFVSSYIDYLKLLKNYEKDICCFISEYSKSSKISKCKKLFNQGKKMVLVITERYYFYNRPKFKKAIYLVFYQIPLNPLFYSELIIMIQNNCQPQRSNQPISISLFSKYDLIRLSNVIGGQKARMIVANKLNSKFIFRPCG